MRYCKIVQRKFGPLTFNKKVSKRNHRRRLAAIICTNKNGLFLRNTYTYILQFAKITEFNDLNFHF